MYQRYDDFSDANIKRRWDQAGGNTQTTETVLPPNTSPELAGIEAKIDALRTTSTMYLDLRPLLLEMWGVIRTMDARLQQLEKK